MTINNQVSDADTPRHLAPVDRHVIPQGLAYVIPQLCASVVGLSGPVLGVVYGGAAGSLAGSVAGSSMRGFGGWC